MDGFFSVTIMPITWNATGEKLPAHWIITGHSGHAVVSRIRGRFVLYATTLGALEWE